MNDGASLQPALGPTRQAGEPAAPAKRGSRGDPNSRALTIRRTTAFVVAAALPAYLAIRGGGYALGVRQELGLVVWAAIVAGLAFGVLPRSRLTRLTTMPLIAVGALALLSLISLSWTGSSEHTFAEVARICIYAGVVALALLGLNRYTWRAAALGIGAAAIGICALALISRLAPGSFDNPVASVFATDRLSYPLNYWNAIGAWGSITAAMGLAWSANSRRVWIRSAALASVPIAGLTVYLTYSRAGVIGTTVGVLAVLALSRNRWTAALHAGAAVLATGAVILVARGQHQIAHATGNEGAATVAVVLAVAVAACAAVAAVTAAARVDDVRLPSRLARVIVPIGLLVATVAIAVGGRDVISRGWHQFQHQRTVSEGANPTGRLSTAGGTRHAIWDTAFDAFDAHQLDGIGPGTFEFYWAQHGSGHEFVRDAHSLYIEELAELGLPGLLVLLAFLGTTLGLAIRGRVRARRSSEVAASTAMCAAGLVFLVHAGVDWMWEETAVGVLGIGAMAVGAAALNDRRRHRPRWRGSRAPLVAAALAPVILLVPGLVSGSREGQSEAALRAGDVADARALADQSVSAEPWSATAYEQRAAVEDRAGNMTAARDDLQEAIRNEPADWRQHLQLSQVELELDHDAAARREYDRFSRMNKIAPPFFSFEQFRRDATPSCLVLGPLACATGSLVAPEDCLRIPPALASLLGGPGVADPGRGAAVRGLDKIYYFVSAPTQRGNALWAVDTSAFRLGLANVVPLNEAARTAFPPAAKRRAARFGVSADDADARAAAACAAS